MYKRSPPAPPLRYRLIATPLTKSKIPTFLDNKFLVKKKTKPLPIGESEQNEICKNQANCSGKNLLEKDMYV